MKIDTMQSHIVAVPPPHIGGMYWIFVTLQTRCGIQGVGEVYASTFHPKVTIHIISNVFFENVIPAALLSAQTSP
jgi:galactonate dehydratase